jgi:hypothetical protein
LRYDAHRLRQASGVIIALEALTQPPNDWVTIVHHPLVGFDRLQGITHSLTAWEAAPPWVWPLSAPSSPDVTCSLPTLQAPRPQVFTTSRQDSVRSDLRVYSTPQALLGYGLQRFDLCWSDVVPDTPASSSFRALHGFLPDETPRSHGMAAPVLPGYDPLQPAPRRLAATGFHLGLRSTLELCSQPSAPRSSMGFTPPVRRHLSWPFSPSGYRSMTALGVKPFPFGGCYPSMVLLQSWMASLREQGASPRGVFAF